MKSSIRSICTTDEKFLLDNCVPSEWAKPLQRAGFPTLAGKDVPRLRDMPLDDDCLYLIYARHHGRILLTCDRLKSGGKLTSAKTGYRIGAELRQRGGAVITVGKPGQPVERMLGKVLFFYESWAKFFSEGSGKVTIGKVGPARECPVCGVAIDEIPGDYRERRPAKLAHLESVEAVQGQAYITAMKQLGLTKKAPRGKPFQKKHVGVTLSLGEEFERA